MVQLLSSGTVSTHAGACNERERSASGFIKRARALRHARASTCTRGRMCILLHRTSSAHRGQPWYAVAAAANMRCGSTAAARRSLRLPPPADQRRPTCARPSRGIRHTSSMHDHIHVVQQQELAAVGIEHAIAHAIGMPLAAVGIEHGRCHLLITRRCHRRAAARQVC